MNSVIHSLPLDSGYSLPSEQECIEHIGSNAHHGSYAAAGGGDPLSRNGVLSQSASTLPVPLGHAPRYIPLRSTGQDNHYQTSGGISDSNSGSISTSPSSNASSLAFQPFSATNVFQQSGGRSFGLSSAYPQASGLFASTVGSVGYSHGFGTLSNPSVRPRLSSMTDPSHSGMLPPARSPGAGNPVSPSSLGTTARENYTTSTPGLNRHPLSPRSHTDSLSRLPYSSLPDTPRSVLPTNMATLTQSSGVSYGGASTMLNYSHQHDRSSLDTPPFSAQENFCEITSEAHGVITPNIEAKIEKGFFESDHTWTCYRRNYFSVLCSYSLQPYPTGARLYLSRQSKHGQVSESIQALAIAISAAVDGAGGKSIELVQHSPKRDKAPKIPLKKERIYPMPPGKSVTDTHGFPMTGYQTPQTVQPPYLPLQVDPESTHPQYNATGHSSAPHQHTFERLQFKSATANNGKRRAQQQYYHVIIELWADVRAQGDPQPSWVKVAHRLSAAVVVRGRSPSHYQNEGPHSSGSRGGGTGSGAGGAGIGYGGVGGFGSAGRSLSSGLLLGSGAGLRGATFRGSQYSLDPSPIGSSSASSVSGGAGPVDPLPTEADRMSDGHESKPMSYDGYQYFPGTIHEHSIFPPPKPEMPVSGYEEGRRVKTEMFGGPLPAVSWSMGGCGRFQGTDTSRGYYPDLNTGF